MRTRLTAVAFFCAALSAGAFAAETVTAPATPHPAGTPVHAAPVVGSPMPPAVPSAAPLRMPAPVESVAPQGDRSKLFSKTLSNGLRIAVVEDHAAPVVETSVWYRFGALDEKTGKTGLAHGLEHMMFRGTPSLSEGGFDEITAREGAQANANTSNDYTRYYLIMPSSRLELALGIEADRMRNAALTERDWVLEKGAVLNEWDGDIGSPTTHLYNSVCATATPIPLCGLGALGVRSDIVASTSRDLRAYYDAYYHPNFATLVVVGDVRPSDVFRLAEKRFGKLLPSKAPVVQHPAPALRMGKRIAENGDTPYATIDIAYPSVGDLHPDAGPAALLDGVVTNARSPLYEALIVSGIALGYDSSISSNVAGGLQHIFITVAPGHTAAEAERVFRSTLKTMLDTGISDDLVAAAKRAALVNAISSRDAIDGVGDRVGYAYAVERRDPQIDDEIVARTTTEQVNAYARKMLAEPSVVGVLTPRRPRPGSLADGGSAVSDNFTGRAPSGPIVKAPWIKALLAKPLKISSSIQPVKMVLPNGLKIFVQPVHSNSTVFIRGQIEGSSTLEPVGKEGLRGMVSSIVGYGGTKYDFDAQHVVADKLGANLSFGESFGAHGLASDMPQLFDVLADGELHPRFEAKYVNLVRSQTLAGIDARDRDPDSLASRALSVALLPPTDPDLRRSSKKTIAAIHDADFGSYINHAYRPDLTTIVVVGDVTPAQVRREVERTFGSWTAQGKTPSLRQRSLPMPKPATKHVLATRRLVDITMAQPAIARSSPDFVALNLLNAMLGGGGTFDTRMMSELREKRGLVYSASSGLEVGKYRGVLVLNLSTDPKNARKAIALAKHELKRFTTEAPSQTELNRARERLVAGSLVAEQSTSVIASHVSTIGYHNLPATYYKNLWKTYEKVTPADILAVAKRRLRPDHLVVVTEGPEYKK